MRSIRWLLLCVFASLLAWGCEDPQTGKEKPPERSSSECSNRRDCLKKRCPQSDPDEYDKCVAKRHSTQEASPEYVSCTSSGTCEDVDSSTMGDGQVEVSFPEDTNEKLAKDSVKWLRLYVFPAKDLDGKDVTCERLKSMVDADPKVLMSGDWGRYYPPPDFDQPVTTDVIRTGDSMDLPFLHTHPTVPAGDSRIFVVQGFCNPPEGRPGLDTKAKWWACKAGIATKAGVKATTISMELPVKNGDRCPK